MIKILFITNKNDLTTDFVIREIQRRFLSYYRLNTEEIGVSVFLSLNFQTGNHYLLDKTTHERHQLSSFTSVYFRRPMLHEDVSPDLSIAERQFLKLEHYQTLEGIYKILRNANWVNPVFAIREAENKIYQQILAQEIGFIIPDGLITNIPSDFINFYKGHNGHCIVKPIRNGQIGLGHTQEIVYTSAINHIPNFEQIELCPSYLQNNVTKKYDIRVTVVGSKVFATAIHSQNCEETRTDWRQGEHILPYEEIELPQNISDKCVKLTQKFHLEFSAIDLILDVNNKYFFLEINPNGQWAWIECRTNYKISQEIANLLANETY